MKSKKSQTKVNRDAMVLSSMEDESIYILKQISEKVQNVSSVQWDKQLKYYEDESGFLQILVTFENDVVVTIRWSKYTIGSSKFLWELAIDDRSKVLKEKYPEPIGYVNVSGIMEQLVGISKQ